MCSKIRKRIMVTEGDLMQLWYEVQQVRKQEKKEQFAASFKKILNEGCNVQLSVTPRVKEVNDEQ